MGDCDDGALFELLPDGPLDEVVRLEVHGGGGLIEDEDAGLAQEGPRQADQLTLALGEVLTLLGDLERGFGKCQKLVQLKRIIHKHQQYQMQHATTEEAPA